MRHEMEMTAFSRAWLSRGTSYHLIPDPHAGGVIMRRSKGSDRWGLEIGDWRLMEQECRWVVRRQLRTTEQGERRKKLIQRSARASFRKVVVEYEDQQAKREPVHSPLGVGL